MDSDEISSQQQIIHEALDTINLYLSGSYFGALLVNTGVNKNNLYSLSLKEAEKLPDDSEGKKFFFDIIKKIGEKNLSDWIRGTLLTDPIEPLWDPSKLGSQPASSNTDPKWIQDIAREKWNTNWFEKLKKESHQPSNIEWIGLLIIFLRFFEGILDQELLSLQDKFEEEKVTQAELKNSGTPESSSNTAKPDVTFESSDEKAKKIREKKRATSAAAKQAFAAYKKRFPDKIN